MLSHNDCYSPSSVIGNVHDNKDIELGSNTVYVEQYPSCGECANYDMYGVGCLVNSNECSEVNTQATKSLFVRDGELPVGCLPYDADLESYKGEKNDNRKRNGT